MTDYKALLQDNTRADEYVNGTKLCQKFGKDIKDYKRYDRVKSLIESVQSKIGQNHPVLEVKRGKGGGTFVHPVIAIDLAEWLSPAFGLHVKEVFIAYAKADVNLARDIVSRTEDVEGLKLLTTESAGRVKQLEGYHNLMSSLKECGCEGKHYAQVNKHNNGLINVETRKKGITAEQAAKLAAIEAFENWKLLEKPTNHPQHAVNRCKKAGNELNQLMLK